MEKIDGTNIRVSRNLDGSLDIRGRTNNAQLHPKLIKAIEQDKGVEYLTSGMTIYAEGIGPKVGPKGGAYGDYGIIAYDVFFNESSQFLPPLQALETLKDMGFKIPKPFITTPESIVMDIIAKDSTVDESKSFWPDLDMGDDYHEGYIARPEHNVYDGNGDRICVKLKYKDLKKSLETYDLLSDQAESFHHIKRNFTDEITKLNGISNSLDWSNSRFHRDHNPSSYRETIPSS